MSPLRKISQNKWRHSDSGLDRGLGRRNLDWILDVRCVRMSGEVRSLFCGSRLSTLIADTRDRKTPFERRPHHGGMNNVYWTLRIYVVLLLSKKKAFLWRNWWLVHAQFSCMILYAYLQHLLSRSNSFNPWVRKYFVQYRVYFISFLPRLKKIRSFPSSIWYHKENANYDSQNQKLQYPHSCRPVMRHCNWTQCCLTLQQKYQLLIITKSGR